MYPYNTPGAFVPHSAINLSVKANELAHTAPTISSLDLSMSEANSYLSTGTGGQHQQDSSASSYLTGQTSTGTGNQAASNSTLSGLSAVVAKTAAANGSTGTGASPAILDLTRPVLR